MNVGLFILLLKSKFPDNSLLAEKIQLPEGAPFLQGEYDDFYVDWYSVVGVSIVTTCFIDAISPVANFAFWFKAGFFRCCDRKCTCRNDITRQTIQEEYEMQYRGAEFQIENRYAKLIAMLFIVMMYSAAIPILYPAGCILMIVSYWADKVLFLRHYRLPRRYGRKLAASVGEILEYAIILHLFFGLYMLSNPDIFTYENKDLGIPEWTETYVKIFSGLGVNVLGAEPERFNQIHTVIYCFGIGIFLILFVIEKITGSISKLIGKCFYVLNDEEKNLNFSTDIYLDLSPEDQNAEFTQVNTAIKHVEYRLMKGDAGNPALYRYYKERLKLKRADLKISMAKQLHARGELS